MCKPIVSSHLRYVGDWLVVAVYVPITMVEKIYRLAVFAEFFFDAPYEWAGGFTVGAVSCGCSLWSVCVAKITGRP